jgi:uncharacterized membrane protein YhaH (DUF805 family)
MKWYLKVLKQYTDFSGRARRKEYWMFFLFNILVAFVLGFTTGFLSAVLEINLGFISIIYTLGILIPSIAVGVRRLHDINRSGWLLIVPIVGFVFLFFNGHENENRFGKDPKAIET